MKMRAFVKALILGACCGVMASTAAVSWSASWWAFLIAANIAFFVVE